MEQLSFQFAGVSERYLDEAKRLVEGPRQKDYEHPRINFKRICDMWSIIFGHDVTMEQFMLAMIALKIAREVATPKRDNLVDIAGYLHAYDLAVNDEAKESNLSGLEESRNMEEGRADAGFLSTTYEIKSCCGTVNCQACFDGDDCLPECAAHG